MTEWLDVDANGSPAKPALKSSLPHLQQPSTTSKSSDIETENRRRSGVVFLFRLAELYGHHYDQRDADVVGLHDNGRIILQ